MNMRQILKKKPALYAVFLYVLNSINYFNRRFNFFFPNYKVTEVWKKRIEFVMQSEDNDKILRSKDAGYIYKNYQIMHNGLKIILGSYYDYGNAILLKKNRGVHEPQEEYVFQEVLKHMPENGCMLELGSYWAFYSMWFASKIKNARCIMIEPDPHKMNFGRTNFKLNKLKGDFDLGLISDHVDLNSNIPIYSVDYLMKKHSVAFLHVLHSDIQGYEYAMLQGSIESIESHKIGYIFISTHSNELHQQCFDFLVNHDFDIISSANLDETFSWDGLLVAKSKSFTGVSTMEISKRTLHKRLNLNMGNQE
jgi:hypothetical protein